MAMFGRLWHSVYAAETACLLLEQSSMTARAILALITLVTGPNSTQLRLMKFMPVTHAI